ncbi:class I SAM-dependent methyltransferase [Oscillospiraceae bacterium WX1]
MWLSDKWTDYELLDCSGGEKLERWGSFLLVRPDPQAIWDTPKRHPGWKKPDARYARSSSGGGRWEKSSLPESWQISYDDLKFNIKPMSFKHTGLFPEQAANWDFLRHKIRRSTKKISVLNLFAYTGGATVAALAAGAAVCHVDAARGMVSWARENARTSGLDGGSVRWIIDDCVKFLEREIRRGRRYDALIMDPPSYGRGPSGEVWKLEDDLFPLVQLTADVLSDDALFVLINSYTTGLSPATLTYMAETVYTKRFGGHAESRELGLPVTESGLVLPCGATCRWER